MARLLRYVLASGVSEITTRKQLNMYHTEITESHSTILACITACVPLKQDSRFLFPAVMSAPVCLYSIDIIGSNFTAHFSENR